MCGGGVGCRVSGDEKIGKKHPSARGGKSSEKDFFIEKIFIEKIFFRTFVLPLPPSL